MAAAASGEDELELEVAAILCDLSRILRAQYRRRRLCGEAAAVIPSWGRRRPRSVLEHGKPPTAAVVVVERDGAASPDTPLAFPANDSVPEEEEEEAAEEDAAAKKARAQAEWAQEQRAVVASLSREKADLLQQIEEYRARLLSSRSANESLKQLHQARQEEQSRKTLALALRHGTIPAGPLAALGLDLNEPGEMAAAQERYWQLHQQQLVARAVTADARRRRLEILRAKPKVASASSCRTPRRRVVG